MSDTIEEQLAAFVKNEQKCYNCKKPTDRFIAFNTAVGVIEAYECLDCRQERVQRQVDEGRRPASDLNQENLPEVRNPAH